MTRKELAADIQKFFNRAMLSPKQIRQYTGWTEDLAREILGENLASHKIMNLGNSGKGQLYHAFDVADIILEQKTRAEKKAQKRRLEKKYKVG